MLQNHDNFNFSWATSYLEKYPTLYNFQNIEN
jgi:hypothetical protein